MSNAAPPPAATRFENTDLSIIYVSGTLGPGQPPDWYHGSRSRGWSGGTASFNRSAGATATLPFTGTSVSWIGFRAPWAGIARVYVDGTFITELDLYSTTELVQTPVFTATNLTAGPHTVTVESTGRSNPSASDYAVVVDAFDVTPGSPPTITGTRVEETAAATTFTSGWTQGDATKAWSGGTAAVSATPAVPGARATFTFIGTTVSWIGLRGPQGGIARVYLDGAFQATVDTYAPTQFQTVNYTATTLAAASHTLTVEVTGQRNAAATDSLIYVDAFDVQSRIEDTNSAIVYSGSWTLDTPRLFSGTSLNTAAGSATRSATAGSRAEFTFTGTSVSWIGFRAPWVGMADVSVDGGPVTRIDLYSPTEAVQVPVFTATGLAAGSHTLRIDVPGVKNPASTAAWVMVDAFDVVPVPAPPVTRVQETDPSVSLDRGLDVERSVELVERREREAERDGGRAGDVHLHRDVGSLDRRPRVYERRRPRLAGWPIRRASRYEHRLSGGISGGALQCDRPDIRKSHVDDRRRRPEQRAAGRHGRSGGRGCVRRLLVQTPAAVHQWGFSTTLMHSSLLSRNVLVRLRRLIDRQAVRDDERRIDLAPVDPVE